MKVSGGCYCGAVRYEASGDPLIKGQCHCRECQYISGGHPNVVLGLPESGFSYVKGKPRSFSRSDLPSPVTREFCADCGTHLLTRAPAFAGVMLIKVGTLDDPAEYGEPQLVIHTRDKQSFHHVPTGVPVFERVPG